jgi:N-acetylmuramoyl-L-alanine amidase
LPGRGTALRVLPPPSAGPQVVASATRPARQLRIVIDAGHGGKDPGAKGPAGEEKDAVLDIARRLAAKLKGELNVDVHMTRADDSYVPLDQRKDLANRIEADMFISIHANASRNGKLYGIETYYLKNSNDRATLRLARLENGVDMLIKGGDVSTDADLNYILSDIIQGQKEADSVLLANHIQAELCDHLETRYDTIRSLGVKQGPFSCSTVRTCRGARGGRLHHERRRGTASGRGGLSRVGRGGHLPRHQSLSRRRAGKRSHLSPWPKNEQRSRRIRRPLSSSRPQRNITASFRTSRATT